MRCALEIHKRPIVAASDPEDPREGGLELVEIPNSERALRRLVKRLVGPAALGLYSVAVNTAEIGKYRGHSIGQAVFEDHGTLDDAAARRILSRSAVVATAGFGRIGPVFGRRLGAAAWILLLLAPGVVARTVGHIGGQILLARGRGRTAARVMAVVVGAASPLWIGGAIAGGINGVAVASTLAYAVQMTLTLAALRTP